MKLQVFLDHGAVPLDNNRVENAIRPTKLEAVPENGARGVVMMW